MTSIIASHASWLKRLAYVWLAAAVVLAVSIGEAAAQSKQILFLHSFGRNFQMGATWAREIQNELNRQSPWPLDIQEESLVTAKTGNDDAEAKFVEYLKALYARRPPDLIIALNGPAGRFIQQHRTDLFPATPMLFAIVDERRVEQSLLTERDAVVEVRFDQVALAENILRLLPETKAIAVIIGKSPNERFWTGEQKRVWGPLLANRAELLFYNDRPFEEILKEVANLPPHSAIFFQQLVVDGAGAVYGDKEPLKRIHEVAAAPIFSYDDTYFTGEVVGGPMFSPAKGARSTAAVAVRMLGGEKASGIKVPAIEFSTPKYDWRQLQRWNISESLLPPGSEILFREQTVWQRYFWQIALIASIILIQAGLISILLSEHRRRQYAEVQARQRMAELARVSRFSTAGELTASIAHEINQPLGSILTNAETAQAMLKSPNPDMVELNEIVGDIVREDRRASEVIRRMRSFLKKAPFEPKHVDFNDIAREAIEFLSALAVARKVQLTSFMAQNALPIVGDRIQLQQVIINLVVNGIDAMTDTADPDRIVSIRTSCVENLATLSVSDRGLGIPNDKLQQIFEPFYTSKAEGMGMGLSIARAIVDAHHGQISARNRDHGGASFRIAIPLVDGS